MHDENFHSGLMKWILHSKLKKTSFSFPFHIYSFWVWVVNCIALKFHIHARHDWTLLLQYAVELWKERQKKISFRRKICIHFVDYVLHVSSILHRYDTKKEKSWRDTKNYFHATKDDDTTSSTKMCTNSVTHLSCCVVFWCHEIFQHINLLSSLLLLFL